MILGLEVDNYKSIEHMAVSFGELNAIIGKNGAGKTTLISIISMVKSIAQGRNINAIINENASVNDFFNCNLHEEISKISVKIQTPRRRTYMYSFSISLGVGIEAERASFSFVKESLYFLPNNDSLHKELVFKRVGNNSSFMNNNATLEVADGVVPFKIDPSVSVLSSYAHDDAIDVSDTLASYYIIWLNDSNYGGTIVNSNYLDLNTIDGVAVDLYMRDRALYENAIETIRSIIPGFRSPEIVRIGKEEPRHDDERERKATRKVSSFVVNWSDSQYSSTSFISRHSLSGGNSRVIFLILSLYNSRGKSCFVAEEIENGMHLTRISMLIDQIKKVVKNRKIQFFFTTHNHLILNDLLPKEVVYVKMSNHGSEYARLSDTKEFQMIRDTLGRMPTSEDVVNSGMLF